MSFVHLHVHSEYSLLDGFSNIKKLVARARDLGMPAVALTDHGTMFGVVDFFNQARAVGVKPIIGLESYLAARRMTDRDSKLDKHSFHMLLLAENMTGYQNLLKIASAAQLEGFYYSPRIDREFLAAHSEGLIASSGCLSAEVPRALLQDRNDDALKLLDWYYSVFGPERFFLELQQHDIQELKKVNAGLLNLRKRYNARYIATNDVHYIHKADARLQDILLAIQTGSLLSDQNRFRMSVDSFYLRTPEEMSSLFAEVPEAISNTLAIAERCNVDLSTQGYHLPLFEVPPGFTPETYLRSLCEEGLRARYGASCCDSQVRERLDYELQIINQMGFDTYFLIVWDLCRYAREKGIWYNARGSANGSMIAYTLSITLVEPLSHGLLFERFLNPGRISMPDVDLDFQDDRRSHMMEYCARKYGEDRVAQIITFGTLGSRAAIRDVGRVMDISLSEVDRVCKLMPNVPSNPVSISDAINQISELKQIYQSSHTMRGLLDTAEKMEGVVRNAGTHAAGVVITDQPMVKYVPLHRPTNGSEDSPIKTVVQFEMSILESLGLLKVDFLGLATLTIMARACALIQQRHGIAYNLDNIPIDDPETFTFLGEGHTAGIFQLEGSGMTRYLMQMKPQNLSNVIAMVALYRPGPLEFIPTYIRRMHGEEETKFIHPSLEGIFKETFGIPVYQEQIMRAAVDLAGYTLSESDELRKAIAKKMKDKLLKHQEKFVAGAVKKGIPQESAVKIFTDWEEFARYGFNKSHAADYGMIAVQTAYLKVHYPAEYMTALLSASKNETAKVAYYAADCRSMGIDVLPPDINQSGWDFTIEDRPDQKPAIRFGLGAVKNVGQNSVELILKERDNDSGVARQDKTHPFLDINDFCQRLDLRQVGKRSLESLIKVGTMDRFGPRKALLDALDRILSVSISHFRAAQTGQMSFFGAVSGIRDEIVFPSLGHIDAREMLEWERELIGLYVSDHPLTPYLPGLRRKVTHFSGQLGEVPDKDRVIVGGLVTKFRSHQTRDGKNMGFVTLEDLQGVVELVLFSRTWERFNRIVQMDVVITAEGRVDNAGSEPKVLVDKLEIEEIDAPPLDPAADIPSVMMVQPARRPTAVSKPTLTTPLRGAPSKGGASNGATSNGATNVGAPAKSPPPPIAQIAEPDPGYSLDWDDDSIPPPPEDPPDDEWEPRLEAAFIPSNRRALAAQPLQEAAPLPDLPLPKRVEPLVVSKAEPFTSSAAPAARMADPVSAVIEAETSLDAPTSGQIPVQALPAPLLSMPFLVPPAILQAAGEDDALQPRMVTVILRALGDSQRDRRRLVRVHGLLVSAPGKDRFSLLIFEGKHHFLIDFPNETTCVTPELLRKLRELVGEENLRVEVIKIQ